MLSSISTSNITYPPSKSLSFPQPLFFLSEIRNSQNMLIKLSPLIQVSSQNLILSATPTFQVIPLLNPFKVLYSPHTSSNPSTTSSPSEISPPLEGHANLHISSWTHHTIEPSPPWKRLHRHFPIKSFIEYVNIFHPISYFYKLLPISLK